MNLETTEIDEKLEKAILRKDIIPRKIVNLKHFVGTAEMKKYRLPKFGSKNFQSEYFFIINILN